MGEVGGAGGCLIVDDVPGLAPRYLIRSDIDTVRETYYRGLGGSYRMWNQWGMASARLL